MKVSEITIEDVIEYIRENDLTEKEKQTLTNLLLVAKEFIKSYTGLTEKEIDTHEDFYIVVLILCQDMWDNRILYVDKGNLNKVVETILGMHCVNLL
jgi:hypothetical protein